MVRVSEELPLCVHECRVACVCRGAHVEVRGQLSGSGSFPPPRGAGVSSVCHCTLQAVWPESVTEIKGRIKVSVPNRGRKSCGNEESAGRMD